MARLGKHKDARYLLPTKSPRRYILGVSYVALNEVEVSSKSNKAVGGHSWLVRGLVLCVVFFIAGISNVEAQSGGVRVGNGRLNPSLNLEARYDTLAGIGFDGELGTSADLVLRIRPGFLLSIPGPTTNITLDAKVDWHQYMGMDLESTRSLSFLGGDAHLGAKINPDSRFSLELGDRFTHSDEISAIGLGAGVRSFFNEIYLVAPWSPGGGALLLKPGYSFVFEGFLSSQTVTDLTDNVDRLNYLSHRPSLDISWRFFPKTAFVLDVRGDIRRYRQASFNIPTNAIYALGGISGLVTPRISLIARGGYGNTYILEGNTNDYESFIGQLDCTYSLSQTIRFGAGVVRTFFPVPTYGWYGDNRGYLNAQVLMAGRLLLQTEGSFHLLDYANDRRDILIAPRVSIRYRVASWMNLGLGYRYSLRRSDDSSLILPSATNYDRQEVFGSLILDY